MISKEHYVELLGKVYDNVSINPEPIDKESFFSVVAGCYDAAVKALPTEEVEKLSDYEQAGCILDATLNMFGSAFEPYRAIVKHLKGQAPTDAKPQATVKSKPNTVEVHRRTRADLKGKIMSDGAVYNYRRHRRYMPYMFPHVLNGNILKHLKRAIHAYRTMKLYPENSWQYEKDISKQFLSYVEHITEACLIPPKHPRWTDEMKRLTKELYDASHNAQGDLYKFIKEAVDCNVYSTNANKIVEMFSSKYKDCWSVIQRTITSVSSEWEENTLREVEMEWAERYRGINEQSNYTNVTTPAIWHNTGSRTPEKYEQHKQLLENRYGSYTLQDVLYGCDKEERGTYGNCNYFMLSELTFMSVFNNAHNLLNDKVPNWCYSALEEADRFGKPYNKILVRIFNSVLGRKPCKNRSYFPDDCDEYDILAFLQTHPAINDIDEFEAYKATEEFKELRSVLYSEAAKVDEWTSLCGAVNHINKIYGVPPTTPEELKAKFESYQAMAVVGHPDYYKLPKRVRALIIAYKANSNYNLENGDEVLSALAANWETVLRELNEMEF